MRLQVNQLFEQFGGKAKLDELKDKAGKVRSPEACNLYKINMLSTRATLHWFLPMEHIGGSRRAGGCSPPTFHKGPPKSWPLTVSSLPSDNGFERFGLRRPGK